MELPLRQVHLDFHNCAQLDIADRFDATRFADTLAGAGVQSVTLFSRCCHGLIYHDTRFEAARHPRLRRNLLAEQIDALHERGIRTPVYVSVALDERVARTQPQYLSVDAEGRRQGIGGAPLGPLEPGWHRLCLNSGYVDYVIAQSVELVERFPVDGLFFDIVSQYGCCCSACLDGMAEHGLSPDRPADRARWDQLVVEAYCRRQTDAVHGLRPGLPIFYNAGHVGPWIRDTIDRYTHIEVESLPTASWGYDHFPWTVRYARTLGLPYLGMTGRFHTHWGDFGSYKPVVALDYDVSLALAHGAGTSIGDQLPPSGELDQTAYRSIGAVFRAAATKDPWCVGARPVTEVAVLTPEAVRVADGGDLSRIVSESARGALRLLEQAHLQFDVVDFDSDLHAYRLLVLPDEIVLPEYAAAAVREYLARGGALIASHRSGLGPDATMALPQLGVDYLGELPNSRDYVRPRTEDAAAHVMYARGSRVAAVAGSVTADVWQPEFERSWREWMSHLQAPPARASGDPAVVRAGRCVYFAHPIFESYGRLGVPVLRELFEQAVAELLPDPLLRTDLPDHAVVTMTRQPGRTIVHVLAYGRQTYGELSYVSHEALLAAARLDVRVDTLVERAYLAPDRTPLPVRNLDGRAVVSVPPLQGHRMVVLEHAPEPADLESDQ